MGRLRNLLIITILLTVTACKKQHHDNGSNGNINEVSIVISDVLWNGEVGDSLRKKFAAPVDGLTQEEPLFTLKQLHDKSFDGDLKKGRNIIVVEKGDKDDFRYKQNRFCSDQNVFTVTGRNIDGILQVIEMRYNEMIRTIRQTEIAEIQKRNKKAGLKDSGQIKAQYGITIDVPATYNYAVQNNDFVWLKKDIPSGNANLLVYRVPYTVIEKDRAMADNIIRMRDSIGAAYIHGQEHGTFMATEEAYSPYLFMTSLADKPALETRGNWEMAGDFMGGPFLNYAIRDDKHRGYLVVEGFIYSPSSPRRDLITELESIIKSVKFL